MTRRRRGGIKKGERKLASNQFPMCSPQSGSLEMFTELHREEKSRGRREIEVARRRRGEIKRGERKLASNHFPMCSPQCGPLGDVHGGIQRREEGERRPRWPGG